MSVRSRGYKIGAVLETTTHGPITRIRMARTFMGWYFHDSSAFHLGRLLIDTGPPATEEEMLAFCRTVDLDTIVITHHHEDHVGGAATLKAALDLPVHAPQLAIDMLAEGLRLPLYRRVVFDGRPRPFRALPLGETVETDGYTFQVIPTPGHAADHVCLFEPEKRWLFSGDLYVHERVNMFRRIENVSEHIESLRTILALEPDLLICSQSGFFDHAQLLIERKIQFWEDLRGQARTLRERGLSDREITSRLLGREGLRTYVSMGEFAKIRLIRGLLRED